MTMSGEEAKKITGRQKPRIEPLYLLEVLGEEDRQLLTEIESFYNSVLRAKENNSITYRGLAGLNVDVTIDAKNMVDTVFWQEQVAIPLKAFALDAWLEKCDNGIDICIPLVDQSEKLYKCHPQCVKEFLTDTLPKCLKMTVYEYSDGAPEQAQIANFLFRLDVLSRDLGEQFTTENLLALLDRKNNRGFAVKFARGGEPPSIKCVSR